MAVRIGCVLALLFVCVLPVRNHGVAGSDGGLSKGWETLPTCQAMKGLNQSMIGQLRNMHQIMHQHLQRR